MTDERTVHEEASQKLMAAVSLVREAIADLDRTCTVSECCGVTRWNHYGDFRAGAELESVELKLMKWAVELRRGTTRAKTENS